MILGSRRRERRERGVKNANPSTESASKMSTLRQKVDVEKAKRNPFVKKCVENAYPLLYKGFLRLTGPFN